MYPRDTKEAIGARRPGLVDLGDGITDPEGGTEVRGHGGSRLGAGAPRKKPRHAAVLTQGVSTLRQTPHPSPNVFLLPG